MEKRGRQATYAAPESPCRDERKANTTRISISPSEDIVSRARRPRADATGFPGIRRESLAMPQPVDVDDLRQGLMDVGYVADAGLATALACGVSLGRAILLEGDAGVGKTDAARALAAVFGAQLLRLQCYEGLDLAAAAYDWNYGKQLLAIRTAEALRPAAGPAAHELVLDLYADEFLIRRPLLAALGATRERGIVLLIDEIDRADDEFEAFLLEFLADFAISIPERGTIAAAHPPIAAPARRDGVSSCGTRSPAHQSCSCPARLSAPGTARCRRIPGSSRAVHTVSRACPVPRAAPTPATG